MSLDFQHVPIQLRGINTKSDDRNLPTGETVVLENMLMQKTNRLSCRYGYTEAATLSNVIMMEAFGDKTGCALCSDGTMYQFDENSKKTIQTKTLQPLRQVHSFNVMNKTGLTDYDATQSVTGDIVNFGAFATRELVDGFYVLRITSYDINKETPRYTTEYDATADKPFKLTNDLGSYIFGVYDASGTYRIGVVSASSLGVGQFADVNSLGFSTATMMDCSAISDGDSTVFVLYYDSVSKDLKYVTYNYLANVAASPVTLQAGQTLNAISVDRNGNAFIITAVNAAGVFYTWSISKAGAITATNTYTTTDTGVFAVSTYKSGVFYITSYSRTYAYFGNTITTTTLMKCNTSNVIVSSYISRGWALTSKVESSGYLARNDTESFENTVYGYFSINSSFQPILHFFCNYGSSWNLSISKYHLLECSNNALAITIPIANVIRYNSSDITKNEYNFKVLQMSKTDVRPIGINIDGIVWTNAWGNPRFIDSYSSTNNPGLLSFPCAPNAPIFYTAAGTGGNLSSGAYQWVLVYELEDGSGKYVYSAISTPMLKTAANQDIINIITYWHDNIESKYRVVLYRTKVNGTVFYRHSEIADNLTVFADSKADTELFIPLYNTGGIVESAPAHIAKSISVVKNRIWIVSGEEDNTIFFSIKIDGIIPSFNDIFVVKLPGIGNGATAVAEMDDKVILFKQNAVYATFGEGPDNLGQGSPFADPQLISTSMGCKNDRSIVLDDAGLMFMSNEGIYVLSRGLQMQYLGDRVEDYNGKTVTGALNLVDRHQVWFLCAEGEILVWDSYFQQWYVFTGLPSQASCLLEKIPYIAKSTVNKILKESQVLYTDDSVVYVPKLVTGWINLASLQGFQRVRKVDFLGKCDKTATVKLYQDFEETTETETFTIASATAGTPYQFEIKPRVQRCESIKIELSFASASSNLWINGMSVEAGMTPGTYRYSRTKRIASN